MDTVNVLASDEGANASVAKEDGRRPGKMGRFPYGPSGDGISYFVMSLEERLISDTILWTSEFGVLTLNPASGLSLNRHSQLVAEFERIVARIRSGEWLIMKS